MALTVTHAKALALADDLAAAAKGEVLPSDWNANHIITGTTDITINTSSLIGGTTGHVLYDNAGTVGEAANFTISSGNPKVTTGNFYDYDGMRAIQAVVSIASFFVGAAGNVTVTGLDNLGMGASALAVIGSGQSNCALGAVSLQACVNGSSNMAMGGGALGSLIDGDSNTAIGNTALGASVHDSNNVAIGSASMQSGNGSAQNTCVGAVSGFSLGTSGGDNVLIGYRAGPNITSGNGNVVIGADDGGPTIVTAGQCIVIGKGCDVPSASANGQMSVGNYIYGTGLTGTGGTISTGWVGIGIKSAINGENLTVNGEVLSATVSGGFPGFATQLTTETHFRLFLGLDGSDNPVLRYGNGSGAPDSFVNRQGAGIIGIGTSGTNTSGTLKATALYTAETAAILHSAATITGGSTSNVPTLTGGPANGNPTKWLPYDDNGTTRYIPSW